MTRSARLASAKATGWVEKYPGKNLVRGYARWFGVDLVCALTELRALGVKIDHEREKQIRVTIANRARERKEQREASRAADAAWAAEVAWAAEAAEAAWAAWAAWADEAAVLADEWDAD